MEKEYNLCWGGEEEWSKQLCKFFVFCTLCISCTFCTFCKLHILNILHTLHPLHILHNQTRIVISFPKSYNIIGLSIVVVFVLCLCFYFQNPFVITFSFYWSLSLYLSVFELSSEFE